jgi:hypothetical protein
MTARLAKSAVSVGFSPASAALHRGLHKDFDSGVAGIFWSEDMGLGDYSDMTEIRDARDEEYRADTPT